MDAGSIGQVRRFNRIVAEGIGALDAQFLGRDRPMGESRLLWEIGSGRRAPSPAPARYGSRRTAR